MPDVGGLIGIDAGVLDEAKAGAADVGVLVGGDAAGGGGAVQADVEIACAGDLDGGDSAVLDSPALRSAFSSAASSVAMARGALRSLLASSKATGRASSPSSILGGSSTTSFNASGAPATS